MRVSKPFILHVPACFVNDLRMYLKKHPPAFSYKEVYFHYIIYSIAFRMLTKKEKDEFIKINMQKFKSVTVSNINKYIKILQNGYFLKSDNKGYKGKESNGYKISERYLKVDRVYEIEIKPKTNLYNKLMKQIINRKAHYSRLEPHLLKMKKEFFALEFNYENAFRYVDENRDYFKTGLLHFIAIQSLKDKRLRYFHISKKNGRLNTNLTNLWKELRPFIINDYVNIDLTNSQPFFLSILINTITYNINNYTGIMYDILNKKSLKTFGKVAFRHISKINQKSKKTNLVNLSLFIEKTKAGLFYESVQDVLTDKSREDVKKIAFAVYYSENSQKSKNKELFRKVYPFISEIIETLKRRNYKSLSIFMQQMESYIFIDCIAKELVQSGIIPVTIHDSVIVKREDQQQALELMKQVFYKQLGLVPTLKIEKL